MHDFDEVEKNDTQPALADSEKEDEVGDFLHDGVACPREGGLQQQGGELLLQEVQQQVTEAAVGERESPQQEGVSVDNRSEQEEEDDWEITVREVGHYLQMSRGGADSQVHLQPTTLSLLQAAPPQERKMMLGKHIFPLIKSLVPDRPEETGKITSMLLQNLNTLTEMTDLLEDRDSLRVLVGNAVSMLSPPLINRQRRQTAADVFRNEQLAGDLSTTVQKGKKKIKPGRKPRKSGQNVEGVEGVHSVASSSPAPPSPQPESTPTPQPVSIPSPQPVSTDHAHSQEPPPITQSSQEPSQQDLHPPPVDHLPSLEEVHRTHIPTLQWCPKAARGEFGRVVTDFICQCT